VNEVINTAKEFLEDEDNIAVLASENGTEAKNVREICRMLLK
jgi:uncharacterized NAD-dependent epimerase/dehydratase family protein